MIILINTQRHVSKSIAMPLIGAGTGGAKQQATLGIILNQLSKLTFDGRVIIVVFEK